jgi:hypothetical protein
MTLKYTRKQYMAGEVSHGDYYGQFVTTSVLGLLPTPRVLDSKDEHFNDIPLKTWDHLAGCLSPGVIAKVAESNATVTAGGVRSISLSDKVCVLKAAARQVRGW